MYSIIRICAYPRNEINSQYLKYKTCVVILRETWHWNGERNRVSATGPREVSPGIFSVLFAVRIVTLHKLMGLIMCIRSVDLC